MYQALKVQEPYTRCQVSPHHLSNNPGPVRCNFDELALWLPDPSQHHHPLPKQAEGGVMGTRIQQLYIPGEPQPPLSHHLLTRMGAESEAWGLLAGVVCLGVYQAC